MTDRDRGYNRFLRILKPELDIIKNAVHKTRALSSENLMVFAYYMKIRSFELGETIAKNMARTARRQLGGRHLLFGEQIITTLNVSYRRRT